MTPGTPGNPETKVIEDLCFQNKKGRLYDFKAPTFTNHDS